jgi:hypothetical protein
MKYNKLKNSDPDKNRPSSPPSTNPFVEALVEAARSGAANDGALELLTSTYILSETPDSQDQSMQAIATVLNRKRPAPDRDRRKVEMIADSYFRDRPVDAPHRFGEMAAARPELAKQILKSAEVALLKEDFSPDKNPKPFLRSNLSSTFKGLNVMADVVAAKTREPTDTRYVDIVLTSMCESRRAAVAETEVLLRSAKALEIIVSARPDLKRYAQSAISSMPNGAWKEKAKATFGTDPRATGAKPRSMAL